MSKLDQVVFLVENNEIQEKTLRDIQDRFVEETTTPKGVGPVWHLRESQKFVVDGEDFESKEQAEARAADNSALNLPSEITECVSHELWSWGHNGNYPHMISQHDTVEEATEALEETFYQDYLASSDVGDFPTREAAQNFLSDQQVGVRKEQFEVNGKNVSVTYEINDHSESDTISIDAIDAVAEVQVDGSNETFSFTIQSCEMQPGRYTRANLSEEDEACEALFAALGGDVEAVEEAGDRADWELLEMPGMDAVFEVAKQKIAEYYEEAQERQLECEQEAGIISVDNSDVSALGGKYVTVFAELESGNYCAETMLESNVGNPCYTNSVREVVANINPDEDQLEQIVDALDRGSLELDQLEGIGQSYGGVTKIDLGLEQVEERGQSMSM